MRHKHTFSLVRTLPSYFSPSAQLAEAARSEAEEAAAEGADLLLGWLSPCGYLHRCLFLVRCKSPFCTDLRATPPQQLQLALEKRGLVHSSCGLASLFC